MAVKKTQPFNFSKSLSELEQINEWFQKDDIDLDIGLSKFKRGLELIKQCRTRLKEVENEFREVRSQYKEPADEDLAGDSPEN